MQTHIKQFPHLLLVTLVLLVTSSVAVTHFVEDPRSCQIIGDTDVYGIGIRLGYYLQWVAVLFATVLAPAEAATARTASNIVNLAVLINTFYSASNDGLIAADWWIVFWMTITLSVFNVPCSDKALMEGLGRLGVGEILYSIFLFAQPWLYFRGLDIGGKPGCVVKVFLFAEIDVYSRAWRIIGKVFAVISCPFAVLSLYNGLKNMVLGILSAWQQDETVHVDDHLKKLFK